MKARKHAAPPAPARNPSVDARVCCPACTHNVAARAQLLRRQAFTVAGQKCPRCGSALDAAVVVYVEAPAQAA